MISGSPPPAPSDDRLVRAAAEQEELINYLERDQLVAGTLVPVPPAPLSPVVQTGLWALRVFVVVLSAMVVYTFVAQLS